MRALHETARRVGSSLLAAATELVLADGLKGKGKMALGACWKVSMRWRERPNREDHAVTVRTLLDESAQTDMWHRDKSREPSARLDYLRELVRALADL